MQGIVKGMGRRACENGVVELGREREGEQGKRYLGVREKSEARETPGMTTAKTPNNSVEGT